MKRVSIVLLLSCMLLVMGCQKDQDEHKTKGVITLSGAWALYPMAVKWAEEYGKIYPEVKFDIAAGGAGKGMADCLARVVDLGMVSREIYPEEVSKGAWWISVTKDAVVPTVNENNPLIEDILASGIKREDFIGIWVTNKYTDWGELFGKDPGRTISVYTRSDACGAAKTWAQYLDAKQEDLNGVAVYGDPGLAEAVIKDVLGIGFNNINFVYDAKTMHPVKGIQIIPIDINEDGQIDEEENFYSTRDKIVDAIACGAYPSPPARDLHLVSNGKPEREIVIEFLKWVLTHGQKYVPEAGYINLPKDKIEGELKKLTEE